MIKFFALSYWKYIFSKPYRAKLTTEIVWCRLRGHPGIVYFNPGGLEPDTHCKRCGEDIG